MVHFLSQKKFKKKSSETFDLTKTVYLTTSCYTHKYVKTNMCISKHTLHTLIHAYTFKNVYLSLSWPLVSTRLWERSLQRIRVRRGTNWTAGPRGKGVVQNTEGRNGCVCVCVCVDSRSDIKGFCTSEPWPLTVLNKRIFESSCNLDLHCWNGFLLPEM